MNIEQGMLREEGGNRTKRRKKTRDVCSTDFDLASLPSLNLLNFRVFRGYLIRQLVPFSLRHSLFDILRFQQ